MFHYNIQDLKTSEALLRTRSSGPFSIQTGNNERQNSLIEESEQIQDSLDSLRDKIEVQKKELRKGDHLVTLLKMLSAGLSVEIVYIILKSLYYFAYTRMPKENVEEIYLGLDEIEASIILN